MNIKWSYYLIGLIYILVIVLKVINKNKSQAFKSQYPDAIQILTLKRDFFTTVSLCCIFATLFINGAALWGGKPLNGSSIFITLMVLGFTYFNSIAYILFSVEQNKALLFGYELEPEEIEKYKVKEHKHVCFYEMTFTKEIDSYNYIKLLAFGEDSNKLQLLWKDNKK